MRAFVLTRFGDSDALEYREDWPEPVAGRGEVRVRVSAVAINNTDIWTRQGKYGSSDDPNALTGPARQPVKFPRIQGADVCGVIDQVGDGVPRARLGERVILDPVLYEGPPVTSLPDADYLGLDRDGGLAEFVTIPQKNALAISEAISDYEAAALPTAYGTAERMLELAAWKRVMSILITGASGGVGTALIQLASLRGWRISAIADPSKHDLLRDMGAEVLIPRGANLREVPGLTVDATLDVVVGDSFPDSMGVIRPGGRYVVAGAIGGYAVSLDIRQIYLRHLQLIGTSLASHENIQSVLKLAESAKIRPRIHSVYPLTQLKKAQAQFMDKTHIGKIVIDVSTCAST